jgi:hypothetical protein
MKTLQRTNRKAPITLGAQERDRNAERDFDLKKGRSKLLFAAFCIGLVVLLLLLGMYMGKDALISDLVKILGGLLAGALGGYGYSRAETSGDKKDDA